MGFQTVALGGVAPKAVGGVGTVAAACKGSVELLGRIGFAYGLELFRIVKGRFLVFSVIYEHD